LAEHAFEVDAGRVVPNRERPEEFVERRAVLRLYRLERRP